MGLFTYYLVMIVCCRKHPWFWQVWIVDVCVTLNSLHLGTPLYWPTSWLWKFRSPKNDILPFYYSSLCEFRPWWHFLSHITVQEFNGWKNSTQWTNTVATYSKKHTEEKHVAILLLGCYPSVQRTQRSNLTQNSNISAILLAKISMVTS